MIGSNFSLKPAFQSCCAKHSAPAQSEASAAAASSSAPPSDSADINFSASPLSNTAMELLSATADDAAKLQGTLDEHEPGEIILRTKPGLSLQSGSVVEDFGAKVLDEFDAPKGIHKSEAGDFLHIKLPAGVSVEQAMAAMAKDDRVAFAEPNHVYYAPEVTEGESFDAAPATGAPNDPKFGQLFGLHNTGQTGGTADADIDALEAWSVATGKDQSAGGPTLAVIDTGIDYNHPDLVDNMWKNPGEIPGDGIDNDNNGVVDDVYGYNAYGDNGDPMDGHSHGTHCAGTIGAQGNNGVGVAGVTHDASLMAVKIFSDSGRTSAAAIIRGIQYSTKMGARITSNSWGGGGANAGIEAAFRESDALHIMAAGNSRRDNDRRPNYPSSYDLPNNLAVAANDHKDNLARFSQWGATSVDLSAPGVDILSTVNGGGYKSYSGTSMATPHVAGAALLVASHYPDISNEELKQRLMDGSDAKPQLDGKVVTGGRLNVNNALTMEV